MNECNQCGMPDTEEGYQSHNCFQYLKARNKDLEESKTDTKEVMIRILAIMESLENYTRPTDREVLAPMFLDLMSLFIDTSTVKKEIN